MIAGGRTPRVIILTNLVAVHFAVDMISFLTVESSCSACPIATTHVLSLSTVKSKPERAPVRFQQSSLARSRNPAIAIDGFLRNFAVVPHAARLTDDIGSDMVRVHEEFVLRRVRFAQDTSRIVRYPGCVTSDRAKVILSRDVNRRILNSELCCDA